MVIYKGKNHNILWLHGNTYHNILYVIKGLLFLLYMVLYRCGAKVPVMFYLYDSPPVRTGLASVRA